MESSNVSLNISEHLLCSGYQPKYAENKDVSARQDPSHTSSTNFSMIFPPPNVTGNIHLGHALTATIQDVIVRWKQKQNVRTCWIPGTGKLARFSACPILKFNSQTTLASLRRSWWRRSFTKRRESRDTRSAAMNFCDKCGSGRTRKDRRLEATCGSWGCRSTGTENISRWTRNCAPPLTKLSSDCSTKV